MTATTSTTAAAAKKYRYTRLDFEPLTTKPLHMDMVFDIEKERVQVAMKATYVYNGDKEKTSLKLNCKNLQIVSVNQLMQFTPLDMAVKDFVGHVASLSEPHSCEYQLDETDHLLIVTFPKAVQPGQQFVIETVSIAHPTANILEGLYFDHTPEGAPQTIITQCQQYGFQRIVPCIDTMDAKAYYTTTIIADKRYTNMITNGDLAPGFFDEASGGGVPKYQDIEGDSLRHMLKYYNHKVNMAPYLFFLGVGTYMTYRQTLEFPDGDTTVIELLAFEGRAEPKDAKRALKMLHDSILWVMVSLGPEASEHCEERKEIYALLAEREGLKAKEKPAIVGTFEPPQSVTPLSSEDADRLAVVRKRLVELLSVWKKTGYKYTGAIYREIAMENSYYGGMENVGNTTIVSSCLCPTCTMDDKSYEYMEIVKLHEYYHNINGSQVTGQSPFEIWLNEAVTVHMQRKRSAALFGTEYSRLSEVAYMFVPALGPLAQDKSATSMSIEPAGFNQTQELVSVVTYSKAPEFVRMVEKILGEDVFNRALDLYHTRYSFGNATTMQWIECMEEYSGKDLQKLARTWLKRSNYPTVEYCYTFENGNYKIDMTQTGFSDEPWEIPIEWALVKNGAVVKKGLYRLTEASDQFTVENEEVDFVSFACGWSFFGISKNTNVSDDQLILQARSDPDTVNKYFAYRTLAEKEKARIVEHLLKLENVEFQVSQEYVDLHAAILFDDSESPSIRSLTLSETNSLNNRDDLSHCYLEICHAKKALLQAVWFQHSDRVLDAFKKLQAGERKDTDEHLVQMHERALKKHLLQIISVGSSKAPIFPPHSAESIVKVDVFALALDMLNNATFAVDKVVALKVILESENREKSQAVQQSVFNEWSKIPDMMSKYIQLISVLDVDNFAEQVQKLMSSPSFNINLSQHSRTVCRGLSQIRHLSLLTDKGLSLMEEVFTKIGKVNQMAAYPILKSFDQVDSFNEEWKNKSISCLQRMQASIDPIKEESLYNQLNIMLKKA